MTDETQKAIGGYFPQGNEQKAPDIEAAWSRLRGHLHEAEGWSQVIMRGGKLDQHCADLRLILSSTDRERGLVSALEACLTAMIDYGDGTCGIHCEAMIDQPTPFPEEIALARQALSALTDGGGL